LVVSKKYCHLCTAISKHA